MKHILYLASILIIFAGINYSKSEESETQNDNITAAFRACETGNLDMLKEFISIGIDVNMKDQYGYSLLHKAVREEHINIVEFLIENGADVNAEDLAENTPLYYAIETGNVNEVKMLVDNKADINTIYKLGITPLICAIDFYKEKREKNFYEIIELLIANGADINIESEFGTPLIRAVTDEQNDIVKLLIDNGADINKMDEFEGTPLHIASKNGNKELVELFISKGANIDVELDLFRSTPLHYAASYGQKEIVKLLINYGAEITKKDFEDDTPLHLAVKYGSKEIVEYLLSKGADLEDKNKYGKTPLLCLIAGESYIKENRDRNKIPVVEDSNSYCQRGAFFLRQNIYDNDRALEDFNAALELNPKNESAYILRGMVSAKKGDSHKAVEDWKQAIQLNWWNALDIYHLNSLLKPPDEELDSLIKELADNHLKDLNMVTGKNFGYIGSPSAFFIISLILSNPFEEEIFLTMTKDKNPYIRAMGLVCLARENLPKYEEIIRTFYQDTAEVDHAYFDVIGGMSIGRFAENIIEYPELFLDEYSQENVNWKFEYDTNQENKEKEIIDIIKFLINEGADISIKDNLGYTPLHYAAALDDTKIAEMLISHGAKINAQNYDGETPVRIATYWGITKMIEFLIEKGADINIKDNKGRTCLKLATEMNYHGISDLLRQHGGVE